MKDFNGWENKEQLLIAAKNHDISPRQLARWHYEGLLPRPSQRSLGRGRGTQTLYPPGTTHLLLALCEIRKNERRLAYVAWQLWWRGYEVKLEHIRKFLRNALREWQKDINDHKANRSTRIRNKALRKALSRVENKSVFKNALLQIVHGEFDANHTTADEIVWDIEEVLGLEPGNIYSDDRLGLNVESLNKLSHLIEPASLLLALSESSDRDLMAARDHTRLLLYILESLRFLNKDSLPKSERWIANFGALVQDIKPDTQALALLLLRAVFNSEDGEGIRSNFQLYKQALQEAAAKTANFIASLPNQAPE